MKVCHVDIESFSRCDLKKAGMYRYAEHQSTRLICLSYAFDDGPVHLWIPLPALPEGMQAELEAALDPGARLYVRYSVPKDLRAWIQDGMPVVAHNAAFERVVLNGTAGDTLGFPKIKREQTICTAVKAASAGIPRALEKAAKTLGTYPKDDSAHNDLLYICKPRKNGTTPTIEEEPKRFFNVFNYNIDDVKAERDLDKHLPDLIPNELKLYQLDQAINDRGVQVDLAAVDDAQSLIMEYKLELSERCLSRTGFKPTQTAKLAEYARTHGYPQLTDMQAPTIATAVKDALCPEPVKYILKLFSTFGMKAISKYAAMERAACNDERLHGMLLFYGAGTGRWSSLIVQLQNLFRPKIKDVDLAIELMRDRDLAQLRWLYDGIDVMKVIASCIRGMLVAASGKLFTAMDFASIEARVLAWLAGQEDILEVFRGHGKIYEYTAAKIYRKAMELINSDERFIGKIAVLALGYGGGKAAFAKMAKQYGVELDEALAEQVKLDWRATNTKITKFWEELETSAINAVKSPGQIFCTKNKKIMFKVESHWLIMRLPSGRRIRYYKPVVKQGGFWPDGSPKHGEELTYYGIDTKTRQWRRTNTYGGKLAENATQATARDLLAHGMLNLERGGYTIVLTVHDEVVTEDFEEFGSLEEAEALMLDLPAWADGLPVAAEGWRGPRYKK